MLEKVRVYGGWVDDLIIVSLLVQKLVKTVVFGLRNVRYGPEGTRSWTIFFYPSPPL